MSVEGYSDGVVRVPELGTTGQATSAAAPLANGSSRRGSMKLAPFLSTPRYLLMLLGTAGTWFVFDYAYYGNSVSAPLIVKSVLGTTGAGVLTEALALQLIVFSVAAIPGCFLAAHFMDRIGHPHRPTRIRTVRGMGCVFRSVRTADAEQRRLRGIVTVLQAPIRRTDQGGYGSFGGVEPVTGTSPAAGRSPRPLLLR